MKKVTLKQSTIIVKSGISNLFRDLADKKIADKKNPVKNDIDYCKQIANLYSSMNNFAKDAYSKFVKLGKSVEQGASVDDVAKTAANNWPDLAKKILK